MLTVDVDRPDRTTFAIGNDLPLVFIVGPNTLESRAHALETSVALADIARSLRIDLIYRPRSTRPTGHRGVPSAA
jgi:3-deoxy-D-manno-octulosonic acid (KDO) 8-phosphate synthase